jgi:hypothetical protein
MGSIVRSLQLILASIALSFSVAASGDSIDEVDAVVAKFLGLYTADKLLEAAEILHCPETYTSAELKEDQAAVAKSLEIFVREFGKIKSVVTSKTNLYVASMTACGTIPYWKEHPDTGTRTLETINESGDKGYVVFSFSEVGGRQVLSKFHQGLPASPGAIERVRGVLKLQMAK